MLNIGVIGLGNIFRVHKPAIEKYARIKALCDIKTERIAEFSGDNKDIFCTTDWHELILQKDIDVVQILTPHYLHSEMAIEAMRNGKDVIVEKPMSHNTKDAAEMIRTSDETGKKLYVIFQNRYNSSSQALKKIADSGEAGRLIGARAIVNWKRTAEYYRQDAWRGKWNTEGGGALINQSIHTLDLLSWLGGPIKRVKGHISTDVLGECIEVEDNAHAVFEYESGATGLIYASTTYAADSPIQLEMVFEKVTYVILGSRLFRMDAGIPMMISETEGESVVGAKDCWGSGHAVQLKKVYECIETQRDFEIDGRSAFEALALVEAIYRSSNENRWVELKKAD